MSIYWCGYYDGYFGLKADWSLELSDKYWCGLCDGDDDYWDGYEYAGSTDEYA
jgi:hypothetical protein